MSQNWKYWLVSILLAASAPAFADERGAGGSDGLRPGREMDPDMAAALAARDAKDYDRVVQLATKGVARDPRNASFHNLLAFGYRKQANPNMDLVFRHYNEALRLDPRHLGAHEYIGEAYLMSGNVGKAKEHAAVLERLCGSRCDETTDLRKAIAAYEAKPK